ncbi:MAG: chitobiase/beta-hexosaminidase C-terminal domain-containing protein, partial [Chloroflexi bacterium]|nr:chitobiase/beta-hexosaminidase C-terminal domain-containing protein [Chloroflexota bacterium]
MKNKLLLVILGVSAWVTTSLAQTVGTVTAGAPPDNLFEPYGVAVDLSNNMYYFTDSAHSQILRFDPSTNLPPTHVAFVDNPQGIAVARGGLIVADTINHVILTVGFNGGVSILAGQDGIPGSANGVGAAAQFRYPYGVAADAAGNIYVADQQNNAVRKIDATNLVTTFATGFNRPVAVAVGAGGQVFVADTLNGQVKQFESDGTLSATVGGFNEPRGLHWIGGATGLLVSDAGNHTVRRVFSSLGSATIGGRGGFSGFVDGPVVDSRFNSPIGLASDVNGVIVVADLYNKALRSINRVQLTPPWFSLPGGEYTNAITVTFSNTLPAVGNVTYHYTTNDTNPTRFSPSADSVTIGRGPTRLQVLSVSPDAINSVIVTNTYTFAVAPLEMLIDGKTPAATEASFNNDVTITNKTATLGATIRFTTNGEVPTTNSPPWTDGLYNTSGILQLKGFRDGFQPSGVLSNKLTFTVATPVLLPAGGEFNNNTDLVIASKTTNAVFHYTQGAGDPTVGSSTLTTTLIDDKLVITNYGFNGPLKILATRAGYNPSEIISNFFNFVVAPIFVEPAGGSFTNAPKLTFNNATLGDELYWTLNGVEPTKNSLQYTGAFDLGTNGTIRVKGFKDNYVSSATVTQVFNLSVAAPVIEPAGATNSNNVTVTLKSATDPVELYWTIDGSTPSKSNGTLYATGTPFSLGTNGLLKVIGIRDGFVSSDVVSNAFSLTAANPKISPAGATNNNDVAVTLSSATTGADLYWTINGSDPSPANGIKQASGDSFTLGTNGTLKVVAVKSGFVDSQIISADFSLKVADPTILPDGITTNNTLAVTLSSTTTGARLYWTIDGSDPTENSALYGGPFTLGTNGVLKVKGFKNGYVSSAVVSSTFNLVVAKPTITPAGATNNNAVTVALDSATPGAQLYWTIDGSDPTTGSALYAGSFSLATNGVLKVKGFKDGFVASEIASAPFDLKVATPQVTPASGTNINTVTVNISDTTDPVELRYTQDGTDPKTSGTTVSISATSVSFAATTNTALRVIGRRSGFVDSEEVSRTLDIQVDKPALNPPGGFFQDGTLLTLSVVRSDASIYYTLNGNDPQENESANNFRYSGPIKINQLTFPAGDLKQVKARAFATHAMPSEIASGQLATNNTLGVARDVKAGIGSTVVIPVVVGLKPDDVLKSLQFRVQVWPTLPATPNLSPGALTAVSFGTNDFVTVISGSAQPGP